MIVLGIDPGKTGALCAMEDGRIVELIDMPDEHGLRAYFGPYGRYSDKVFVEKVGGLPGQSAPRAFGFGFHCGLIHAWAMPNYVTPQRWKADLVVPRDKKLAQARATELMPAQAHRWPLAKHHGRAEAALIALWGTMYG